MRWLANLILVAGSMLVVAGIAEVGLRVAGIGYPVFYQRDVDRGSAHRPGAEGWFRDEGESYVRINSAGFRDLERSLAKPAGTVRVALLGDSMTEGLQVPFEQTFGSVAEQRLKTCPAFGGRPVEVLNFGVTSYGTAQELITLQRRVWDYSPDIVVLAFFGGNDVRNNSKTLEYDNTVRPFYLLGKDSLVLDTSFRRHASFGWAWRTLISLEARSRILQVMRRAHDRWAQRAPTKVGAPELGLDVAVYRTPTDTAWISGWAITDSLLARTNQEVRAHHVDFGVVTLTDGPDVHPDSTVRQRFQTRLGVADLFLPKRRVAAVGRREGFPVLTLAPAFQQYAESHHEFLHGFHGTGTGHYNALGHSLAGGMIADWLCAMRSSALAPAR